MPIDPSNSAGNPLPMGTPDLADGSPAGGRPDPDSHATPDIASIRQAWREGVEGGYQPAEAVFAELGARYATPHRGA